VEIFNSQGAEALNKPRGKYITVEIEKLLRREDDAFRDGAETVAESIRAVIPAEKRNKVLVVGLGNPMMTPDALGPLTLRSVMVTRHLREEYPEQFQGLRSVAAMEPGVLGMTGMESAMVIKALTERICPDVVVAVDALASRRMARVCRTVQIADSGIIPGSGVGNAREALTEETLGIPVVAIGVPTVVDAAALAADVAAEAGAGELDDGALRKFGGGLIVTPRDIDSNVKNTAKLIGYGINLALHEDLTVEAVDMFVD
jgi:spore protease